METDESCNRYLQDCNGRGTIISEDGELEECRRRRNMCSVDCCLGAGWPEFNKKSASTPSRPSSDQKSDEKASIGMCKVFLQKVTCTLMLSA